MEEQIVDAQAPVVEEQQPEQAQPTDVRPEAQPAVEAPPPAAEPSAAPAEVQPPALAEAEVAHPPAQDPAAPEAAPPAAPKSALRQWQESVEARLAAHGHFLDDNAIAQIAQAVKHLIDQELSQPL